MKSVLEDLGDLNVLDDRTLKFLMGVAISLSEGGIITLEFLKRLRSNLHVDLQRVRVDEFIEQQGRYMDQIMDILEKRNLEKRHLIRKQYVVRTSLMGSQHYVIWTDLETYKIETGKLGDCTRFQTKREAMAVRDTLNRHYLKKALSSIKVQVIPVSVYRKVR
jgi:hypothetical protein